jgi:FlaA1/EpsC-like NDP-sugar epimerase
MKQKGKSVLLLFLDILLINISLGIAYYLKFEGQFNASFKNYEKYILQLVLIATTVKGVSYFFFRLYSSLWKYAICNVLIICIMSIVF